MKIIRCPFTFNPSFVKRRRGPAGAGAAGREAPPAPCKGGASRTRAMRAARHHRRATPSPAPCSTRRGSPTARRTTGPFRGRSPSARRGPAAAGRSSRSCPWRSAAEATCRVWPVPMVKPEMRPSNSFRPPYMSTSHRTRWPIRRSASWVSLKLASTQISVSERTAIRLCPAETWLPGLTLRLLTTPSISLTISQ